MFGTLALKRKKERENLDSAKPTGLTSLKAKPQSCIQEENPILTKTSKESVSESNSIMDIYEPFLSDGFASLNSDYAQSTPIKILRDTGASQSLILADTLPFSEKSSSGTSVLIQGVECGFVNVPLHNIYLSSDLVTGPVAVGISPSLPFKGIHLLLGNDLAGDKVVVNPLLTSTPCVDQPPDPIEQEIPDLYPSCAVTRAMAKKAKLNHGMQDIDLTDTLIGQSFNKEISTSLSPSQSDIQTDPSNPRSGSENDLSPSNSNDQGHDQMSRSQLCKEQHSDSGISPLFERALDEKEISQVPVCYYVKNGILMRKWRPPDVSAEDEWTVNHQTVIPRVYRPEILNLAHETPMSGHLGVNKTYHKILNHFYWPGIKSDVSQHCKSCHTCQMVGKPNQTIPKAQLQPIPAFDEPFSRVIIDCVGPLPKTKKGCEYLLTIMCASTRFPEAIPLRNIKAKTIVNALVKFFTFVGLPKSIQSDQGSNFMSGIFQQVMYELGIKQYKSSAYHPESQGALERFHQTLKNMIRSYCFDTEKDWDEAIHLLLFAVRESVQESLGFSPFELVFGHTVRGPLKLLKEKFLSDDDSSLNLLQYVSDFKNRLSKACDAVIPLTDRAKEISAFVTPDGLYQYKVMPFGMKNSPATFQQLVNSLISNLDGCKAYIDDAIIFSEEWQQHLQTIRTFFDRLSDAKLTVNLAKSEFCHANLTFLGHIVGQGKVKPVEAKVEAISDFPVPTSKRQLMRFLCMAGYYRKF